MQGRACRAVIAGMVSCRCPPTYLLCACAGVACTVQVGEFLMVGLAFALSYWRHLALACASINAACLLVYPAVPESARWLLSRGRTQEAAEQLQRMAAANRTSLPPQRLVSSHDRSRSKQQLAGEDAAAAYVAAEQGACTASSDGDARDSGAVDASISHLLAQPRLAKRLLVLLLTSLSLMLNYYGISMGAGGIPGSMWVCATSLLHCVR
jgi:hypothetical protein